MKEVEVAQAVIRWLEEKRPSWRVYQELKPNSYGGVADIVCIRDVPVGEDIFKYVWVIEVKTSLTLAVIKQASGWDVDFRSVAVLSPKSRQAQDVRNWWYGTIKRKFGLGSITVDAKSGKASERRSPPLNDLRLDGNWKTGDKWSFIQLTDSELVDDFGKAGSANGGYWTPYKQTMLEVKEFLVENPGSTSRQIVEALGKMHYKSIGSARSSITQALSSFEKEWCRTEKLNSAFRFYVRKK